MRFKFEAVTNNPEQCTDAVMMKAHEQFKADRAALGWSQAELASRLNVTVRAIHNYETGRRGIHPSVRILMDQFKNASSTADQRH